MSSVEVLAVAPHGSGHTNGALNGVDHHLGITGPHVNGTESAIPHFDIADLLRGKDAAEQMAVVGALSHQIMEGFAAQVNAVNRQGATAQAEEMGTDAMPASIRRVTAADVTVAAATDLADTSVSRLEDPTPSVRRWANRNLMVLASGVTGALQRHAKRIDWHQERYRMVPKPKRQREE